MLILTRRIGQSIIVGDNVTITITAVDTRGSTQVRVGITAPADVQVDREEIRLRRDREKARALA